jgi:hypothetical protein
MIEYFVTKVNNNLPICKYYFEFVMALAITAGGRWRCCSVAVARVFALVVRCSDMMLFVYYRVGKNRDTWRESPAAAGAGRTADH